MSEVVGFLCVPNIIFVVVFIVRSSKFNPSSCSSSNVNLRSGEMLLNLLWISFMSEVFIVEDKNTVYIPEISF